MEIVPIATKRLVQFDEWHDELRASVRRKECEVNEESIVCFAGGGVP